ncbi:Histidine kinase [Seminavis robusta]|uniref:Histidine kinase n=1 Tax=Seminavis robusta TaxID=568900 RepID=A0A9N8H7C0_9STRA|nr:Histidine kinase [Seminavis robusta]|eukprot:Sro199_g084390.1 Histidine kinase (276) ;mRNA; r:51259-52086
MGFKIFSRRSSPLTDMDGYTKEDYLQLQQENRRLRQITARIATKIGLHVPKNSKPRTGEEEYCPPPHVIMAQAHRLNKLNELVVALSQAPRVADAYKIVAEYTREIVGAARVSISLLSKDETGCEQLEIYGLDGTSGAMPLGMKLPLAGTQIGHVVRTREPVRVMDCAHSEFLDCRNLSQMGVQACVDVPLISSGRVLGTLNTGVTDRAVYYPEVEQMLLQISSVLACAIEKERLLEEAMEARNKILLEKQPECNGCRNKRMAEKCGKAPRSVTN